MDGCYLVYGWVLLGLRRSVTWFTDDYLFGLGLRTSVTLFTDNSLLVYGRVSVSLRTSVTWSDLCPSFNT